ncbi:MAG: hypothetical protein ACLTE2_06060 [Eubacteriales bacterium]
MSDPIGYYRLSGGSGQTEDETTTVLESRHIANTIQKMVKESFLVTENGKQRPVKYGDFVFFCAVQTNMPPIMQKSWKNTVFLRGQIPTMVFRTVEVAVMLVAAASD